MTQVKRLTFNWRQVGSTQDRDGCGEDYDIFETNSGRIGDVKEIIEEKIGDNFTYLVTKNDGSKIRVFNPNFVEYL